MRAGGMTRRKIPGRGVPHPKCDLMRIVVAFDHDTFAEIRNRALKEGVSFAEIVRQLVEWGLEA